MVGDPWVSGLFVCVGEGGTLGKGLVCVCVFLCRGVPCVSDRYVYGGGEDPWISDWFVCMCVWGGGGAG